MTEANRSTPRAVRLAMPMARDVVEEVAKRYGVCVRPVPVIRANANTGESTVIDLPCGATLAASCQPCAERNRQLRMAQCREGWHLETEPIAEPDDPSEYQSWLIESRADLQAQRDAADRAGQPTGDLDEAIEITDEEINRTGIRGRALPTFAPKRTRSTRRRHDAPELPKRRIEARTLGRTFTSPQGNTYRPSLFVTLTLPSYGKVNSDGTPVDPDTYDYRRAARDALHFSKLVDRFVQNLRRVAGYDVQYFASVEPQRRLAPHLHMAVRGTLPRADVKAVAAATYHQVWWPTCDVARYSGDELPTWVEGVGYVDPTTGELLPTWDEALAALDQEQAAEPLHVCRLGPQMDVQGVLAGTTDADQRIRYLAKYLTKAIGACHGAESEAQQLHMSRLNEALRYEPCSPACANWLRYGIQPRGVKAGLRPGYCQGKAHKAEHLGYAGRRVLVSRKWSNKTMTEHARDRRTWVLEALGLTDSDQQLDPQGYIWRPATSRDQQVAPLAHRLLRAIAERQRWRALMGVAEARARGRPGQDPSATQEVAA